MSNESLSAGVVAKICKVTARTVTKWCDNGVLRSYKLPMSHHRRILAKELVRFFEQERLPVVLLVGNPLFPQCDLPSELQSQGCEHVDASK